MKKRIATCALSLGILALGCSRDIVPSGKQSVACQELLPSGTPVKAYSYDCEVEFKKLGSHATLSITGPWVCEVEGKITHDSASGETSFVAEGGKCARTPDNSCGATIIASGRLYWTAQPSATTVDLKTKLLAYKKAPTLGEGGPKCASGGDVRSVDLHKVGLEASKR